MFLHCFGGALNISWFRPENDRKIVEPIPHDEIGSLQCFSPNGTYLGCKKNKHVIALQGGSGFESVREFTHFNVDSFDVSPNGSQLLTVSSNQNEVIFWDVETGAELRNFELSKYTSEFKWSNDGKFIARASLSKAQQTEIDAKAKAAEETGFPVALTL